MPFRSEAQRRFLHARHPSIAKRWSRKYGVPETLPEKVSARRKKVGRASAVRKRTRRRIRWRNLGR